MNVTSNTMSDLTISCSDEEMLRVLAPNGKAPVNDLLYKPPDTCACFYQSKLEYLCALASAARKTENGRQKTDGIERLEKGPAYGAIHPSSLSLHPSGSWPTYRRDAARSAYSPAPASTQLKEAWQVKLGGTLTQPVIAAGKTVVAAVDTHTVYAMT